VKRLVLTEKPSVGRDIAKGLGQTFKSKDGFMESSDYVISWAFGHLIELCTPAEHDPKWEKWNHETLPVIPASFRYKVTSAGKKQFAVLKELIARKDISEIVNCGDPGREGELIQRLILFKAGNKKPVLRFWTSKALTAEAVQEGFRTLRPAADFDRLYDSALARSQADWIVGMSCSRAVSISIGGPGNVYSIGRVQTPLLRILVDRENEIRNFVPQDYWTLAALFKHAKGEYVGRWFSGKDIRPEETEQNEDAAGDADSFGRIRTEAEAKAIEQAIQGQPGTVLSVDKKDKADPAPLLFSLTTLQQEANRRFGFSAQKTLDLAQQLYEDKQVLSYPRTEAQHLNEEMATQCQDILRKLTRSGIPFDSKKCTISAKNKRVFDSSKLTDHYALIPLGAASGLNADQAKIYELVVRRFVAAFYPAYKYKTTKVITGVGEHRFLSMGKMVVDPGWREIWGSVDKDTEIPALASKDPVKVEKVETEAKKTMPPSRYTDASILAAMANAARFVTDGELKKILKETAGLGTPATRAAIIQTLIDRKYVERSKKNLVPTDKGMHLIKVLRGEKVIDPAYTAVWEQTLDDIAGGKRGEMNAFQAAIASDVKAFVLKARTLTGNGSQASQVNSAGNGSKGSSDQKSLGNCPVCGMPVIEWEKGYSCSAGREKCSFILWKDSLKRLGGKQLTRSQVSRLLERKPIALTGLKSKSGNRYDASGVLSEYIGHGGKPVWGVNLQFDDSKKAA